LDFNFIGVTIIETLEEFSKESPFAMEKPNDAFAQYFVGKS
jgi:hypothetical protein